MKKNKSFGWNRFISDYLPTGIGAGLMAFLLWSFVLAPYVSPTLEPESEEIARESSVLHRQPLSVDPKTTPASSYSRKTDYMPERSDIPSLLNKSLSIDPLLNTTFALGARVSDWDEQRSAWSQSHPGSSTKLLLITGSQPTPCQNLLGDYLLLRSTKNKIDYARLHDIDIFYNVATFTADMPSWWVKLPLIRSLMLSRPDVEWLWWMDSDAVFTDMSFQLPLEKYSGHNFVIHGWEHLVYGERKWTGLNMGIFLVRNCQWTLDLFDTMAPMGYRGSVGDRVGKVLTLALSGRPDDFESDDQGAFVYLLNADRERWGSKVYLESSYYLNGYWKDITERYEEYMRNGESRPFVTHFTGCQICSGKINSVYTPEDCRAQMERALVFADNQVLKGIGYVHPSLSTHDIVRVGS